MRSSLIYVALLGATLALSATAQTTGCYLMEGSSTAISGCTCHSTCMKCGYNAGPDGQSDCVTCANGGLLFTTMEPGFAQVHLPQFRQVHLGILQCRWSPRTFSFPWSSQYSSVPSQFEPAGTIVGVVLHLANGSRLTSGWRRSSHGPRDVVPTHGTRGGLCVISTL